MVERVNRAQVTEAIDAIKRTAPVDSSEAAASEARRLARKAAPLCIAFLVWVVEDEHSSIPQRVRASTVVLECAGLLLSENRPTGLFGNDAPDTDGSTGEAASQRQP